MKIKKSFIKNKEEKEILLNLYLQIFFIVTFSQEMNNE